MQKVSTALDDDCMCVVTDHSKRGLTGCDEIQDFTFVDGSPHHCFHWLWVSLSPFESYGNCTVLNTIVINDNSCTKNDRSYRLDPTCAHRLQSLSHQYQQLITWN